MPKKLAIYIHYPFCKAKCPYCDFNSHVSNQVNEEEFILAYKKQLQYFKNLVDQAEIVSIFFGGGTPSLMSPKMIAEIISTIDWHWGISNNAEITLEANPTSFESKKFTDFKAIGINRLSIGVQALNPKDLKFLGREHSEIEAIETIEFARKTFDNFSFDLIYARPEQNIDEWQKELRRAINLGSNHLSLYQLTIEKGTKFFGEWRNGKIIMPNEDLSADMYIATNELMASAGFEHYEISNYTNNNKPSVHNLCYWQMIDYIGIGAGAHSRIFFDNKIERTAIIMMHQPQKWLENSLKDGSNGIQSIQNLTKLDIQEELLLVSLRTNRGIRLDYLAKYLPDLLVALTSKTSHEVNQMIKNRYINFDKEKLTITNSNWILANQIIKILINKFTNHNILS